MSKWHKVLFSDFLTERKNRFKPKDATALGLKRVDKINFSAEIFISDKPTNTDMILVKKGDLLISGINAEKGAIAVYEGDEDVLASIHYSSYQFDKKKINIEYLKWFLISDAFKKLLKEQSGGGIKTELKAKHILPLQIDLPNLETQKEIVKTISVRDKNYSELFSELTTQQTLVTQLRQSILQEAVKGKLVKQNKNDEPASELLKRIETEKEKLIKEGKLKKEKSLPPISLIEIPYQLPEGWEWYRLGEMGKVTGGGTPSMQHSEYWDGDILWVTPKDMKSDLISISEMKITKKGMDNSSANLIPNGSILIVGRSGILKRMLPVCINVKDCTVNQDLKVLIPYLKEMNEYIQLMLKGHEHFILSKLVKYGTTVHSLKYKEFELQVFPLPPLPEQKRILEKVTQLMQHCNELEQQVQQSIIQAQHLMQAVLREAFHKKANNYEEREEELQMVAKK
jgi:restriction endonuclease S subunit